MRRGIALTVCWVLLCAAAPPVEFVARTPDFADAADDYRTLWAAEGVRIAAALESATGLAFPDVRVEAIVTDGPPMTAYDGRSMRLRADYSPAYKQATLVHEMGTSSPFACRVKPGWTITGCSTSFSTTSGPIFTAAPSPTGWSASSAASPAATIITPPGPGRWR